MLIARWAHVFRSTAYGGASRPTLDRRGLIFRQPSDHGCCVSLYSADAGRYRPKPRGFTAVGVFLFFGAVMATLAETTLLRRGTPLDRLWALNPTAYNQLAPLGGIVVIFFLALAVTLITQESGGSAACPSSKLCAIVESTTWRRARLEVFR